MKKHEISLVDIERILNGEIPLEFYFEIILRTVFVFLVLTFGIKYLGKRLSSQLTRSELAATATLAAATGLVILTPERGLLPPLVVVGVVIFFQRFLHRRSMISERFESLVEGNISRLVTDGVMDIKSMTNARISREQLFVELRGMEIVHLGQVKRLYLEANGGFSLVKNEKNIPGLPVIPEWDRDLLAEQTYSSLYTCHQCGHLALDSSDVCPACHQHDWRKAQAG